MDRKSNIGDGPIFIKKSTDFNSSVRRNKNRMGSQKSLLGGTMDQREVLKHLNTSIRLPGGMSGQASQNQVQDTTNGEDRSVSDFTHTTDMIRLNDSRIL